MSFTGIYQFGSITTKNGQTIDLNNIKIDDDGKISQRTYSFIQKELGLDTLELSEEPQKGEKQVTDFEFVLWNQEANMQETFDAICVQVSKDFIGDNAKYSSQVLKELRQFLKDFKAENSSDAEKMVDMADRFKDAIEVKYNEIKESIFGSSEDADYEKIQQEWDEYCSKFEKDQSHAKSIKEYVQLGREYLTKHSEYTQKMLACNDISPEMRTDLINGSKADMETAKMYSQLMADSIDMTSATEEFISKLMQNCPGWKDLEDNPIIAEPDLYMLRFSQTFEPSIIEPSMTSAYRNSLNNEYEHLFAQYQELVENGKINVNEEVNFKPEEEKN